MNGILDLHVDSIIQQRLFRYAIDRRHHPGVPGQPLFWHADIPRMIEAGYRGACMGIHYYPWESERGWAELQRQVSYLDEVAAGDDRVVRVRGASDWDRVRGDGKLGLVPGIEGAHMLNARIERVSALAEMGVAYLTLTHFSANAAATPSIGRGANELDGLTAFGRRLVRELNYYGIAVDVAHVNTPGVIEACQTSRAPVFCTHTGVRGVHDDSRNITDAELDAIAETGGVVGIILAPVFLAGKLRADTEVALDHYEYVIDRVGIDHVAIGSDYDGWLPTILSDHRDCRDIHRLVDGLRSRGYGDDAIEGLVAGNALRAFRDVDRQAGRQATDTPAVATSEKSR